MRFFMLALHKLLNQKLNVFVHCVCVCVCLFFSLSFAIYISITLACPILHHFFLYSIFLLLFELLLLPLFIWCVTLSFFAVCFFVSCKIDCNQRLLKVTMRCHWDPTRTYCVNDLTLLSNCTIKSKSYTIEKRHHKK